MKRSLGEPRGLRLRRDGRAQPKGSGAVTVDCHTESSRSIRRAILIVPEVVEREMLMFTCLRSFVSFNTRGGLLLPLVAPQRGRSRYTKKKTRGKETWPVLFSFFGQVFGREKDTFTAVPSHLYYILREVLKNSCRATVEHGRLTRPGKKLPPVKVGRPILAEDCHTFVEAWKYLILECFPVLYIQYRLLFSLAHT